MKHNWLWRAFAALIHSAAAAPETSVIDPSLSGKNDIPDVELVREWKVFFGKDLKKQEVAALRTEDDQLVLTNGSVISAVRMKHAPVLDLARGKKHSVDHDRAAVVGSLYAKKPCSIYIGMGADWWIDAFCNGKYFGGTGNQGNENWPPTSEDHVFKIDLRAGRNDLVFFVRPGSGTWQLALDFYRNCTDPDIPSREMPEPGIAFGPILTNPGATSVTITYLLNGRQPLELEYRRAGEKEWTQTRILRGYQILDEAPYMQFQLQNLVPDSTYEYRALIRQPQDHYLSSVPDKIHTFRTYSEKPQNFSFYLMGDTQDTTKRKNLLRLKRIQDGCPALQKADLYVHVGDFHGVVDNYRSQVFDSLLKLIPAETFIVSARGNHEFDGPEAQQWLDYFNYKDHKSYGILRLGEVCLLVLDTGHHLPPDSDNCMNVHIRLNRLDVLYKEQKLWLQQVLKSPEFQTAKFRIVVAHVAPHGHNSNHFTDTHMIALLQKMTEDLFKGNPAPYPVDLWLAGHTHVYRRNAPDKDWNFPVVVIGGGGPNAAKHEGLAMRFDVKPGEISITTLNWDGSVLEKFFLKK